MISTLYSTCQSCGEPLIVTYMGQESHPSCPQTEAEQLARQFVDAVQRDDAAEADRLEKLLNRPASPQLGSSALWYAQHGWRVFPLQPNDKAPAVKNGFKDATTDLERIKAWWDKHPESNIGVPTGERFDVIDIDGPEGIRSLSDLDDDAIPDVHGKVGTPRGFHLYVLPDGHGNRAGALPGIDYRGVGGYVVAPPSRLDFKRWMWLARPSPKITINA